MGNPEPLVKLGVRLGINTNKIKIYNTENQKDEQYEPQLTT